MRSHNTKNNRTGQWRLSFWPPKARKRAAVEKLDQMREVTRDSLVTVQDDTGNLKFLPAGKITALTNASDIGTVMSYDHPATPDVVRFVCTEAQKIFLSLVLQQGVTAAHMSSIMKDCFRHGINDKWLPVECAKNPQTAGCKCPLIAHAAGWEAIKVVYHLQDLQWSLLAPVFNSEEFVYNIPSRCVLPFLKLDSRGRHGHFSIVHKATLHPDHLEMEGLREAVTGGKTRKGIQVALKELKNVDDSPDYNVEKAWEHEVSCLARISTLCHPNLIRPLAGIKKGPKHYIMFEWADGGSLRDIWIRQGQNPKPLDGDRIICFLEQFCGLTGALLAMHNPNSRSTGHTDGNESGSIAAAGTSRGSSISILRTRPVQDHQSLQVPELRLPGEHSSEEGSFMSEDPDVHWRHGDLKPDNILVFKTATNSRSWLGTLKIADLGLAKQHVFSTSNRIQPTGQRYTTSQYEAPEAMPNFREPRSRKYDIWSMGCILLEFVILLLYGGNGLNVFYGEHRSEGNSTDTLYFTVTDRVRGQAELSNIADHWINNILQDRECTRKGRSVFRDLALLVKDKLLVVDYTHRIGADELAEELANILREAKNSARAAPCYLFGRQSRTDMKTPETSGGRVIRTRRSRSQFLGDDLPRIHTPQTPRNQETYTHVRLDKTWDFPIDNSFAMEFLEAIKSNPVTFPPQPKCGVRTCTDCSRLGRMARSAAPGSTWALKLEGGLLSLQKKLERQDHSCPTRSLILHACSSLLQDRKDGKSAAIEIHRIGSNLFLKGHSSPLLSLRRWTRTGNPQELSDRDSLKGNSTIQIGWPDLPLNIETPAFLGLLRSWLRDCERNHQQCRVGNIPQPPSGQFLPTRLLDVGRSRTRVWLRETKHMTPDELRGNPRYLALSHPWGDAKLHDHFCTTHANIGSRLLGGTLVQDFPKTLKDAIRVTQAINIRYLWVDTLCIIQGHDGDFETEAKRMEMVYSMAFLVIAASRATGTSDGFLSPRPRSKYVVLPGQPNSEDLRNGKRQEEREDNSVTYLCEAIDDFQKDVIDGALNKRGWVLQERALARRTIYFTRTQTYFECGAGVRCETLAKMTNDQAAFLGDPNFPAMAMKSTKGAKIRLCQSLYETYSALEFTKVQDRSIAIAGLEQRLVRAYNTDGAYGVLDGGPSFFGRTLLWMRNGRVQNAMRPIDFDFPSEGGEGNVGSMYYVVPSWSWMAYEGVITFMDLPFSGVEWRYVDEGLVAPWTVLNDGSGSGKTSSDAIFASYTGFPTDGSATWHTGRTEWKRRRTGPALKARARKLAILSDPHSKINQDQRGGEIIFDGGKRPEELELKCVIIGRKRISDEKTLGVDPTTIQTLDHYVLVVAHRGDLKPTEYIRVGVGSIPGSWIDLGGPGEKILVV